MCSEEDAWREVYVVPVPDHHWLIHLEQQFLLEPVDLEHDAGVYGNQHVQSTGQRAPDGGHLFVRSHHQAVRLGVLVRCPTPESTNNISKY